MAGKWWMVWGGGAVGMGIRVLLVLMGSVSLLDHRVEVVSPVTSLSRLAEGHWLKEYGISPYAGSAYHGSPLLLSLIGPIIGDRQGTSLSYLLRSSLLFVVADLISALLLRSIGKVLERNHAKNFRLLGLTDFSKTSTDSKNDGLGAGDVSFLIYLFNPFTIAVCVGGSTSSIENLLTCLCLYGAASGKVPLAGFGWAMATHLSMYPVFFFIPIACLLANGPDSPPRKLFELSEAENDQTQSDGGVSTPKDGEEVPKSLQKPPSRNKWTIVSKLVLWSAISWVCILGLCKLALQGRSSLVNMFLETYKYMLTANDLTPNLGLFWYFFTEVFDFFRTFFLMVFHANIIFMVPPLTIRLHHRPIFLAFLLTAICSMVKSYPTVGDAALYMGLMALCFHELSDLQHFYLLLNGYILISVLGPVMYNLWIFRGTGNANFYFAINLVYATLQTVLIVESASTVIRFDRNLQKQIKLQSKSMSS
jgi:phosphatidylinositol glycan class U